MDTQLLEVITDVKPFLGYTLEEREDSNGKKLKYVRGIFQECDKQNQNKRTYPRSIWERITKDNKVVEQMANRETFGELDHPADGNTELKRTSHIITKLELDGPNVIGEAEILDTPNGRILEALLRAGTGVGISSRGTGSVEDSSDGSSIVKDDYQYRTFDFVSNPSVASAYPQPVFETVSINNESEGSDKMKYSLTDVTAIEEDVNLLGSTLKSIDKSSIGPVVKKLVEHEITINKLVAENSELADYGNRVKSSISNMISESQKEITDTDRLMASIKIIEAIKVRYTTLKESTAKTIMTMRKKYKVSESKKISNLGTHDKQLQKKYDTALAISEELVKRHKLMEKKYYKATEIAEELVRRHKLLEKKYDMACSISEELVEVGKEFKVKLEQSTQSLPKSSIRSVTEKRSDFQKLHSDRLPSPKKGQVVAMNESVKLMHGLVSRMPVGSI